MSRFPAFSYIIISFIGNKNEVIKIPIHSPMTKTQVLLVQYYIHNSQCLPYCISNLKISKLMLLETIFLNKQSYV